MPGLDLPGLDITAIARGYGCTATVVETPEQLGDALAAGLRADGPTVLPVPVSTEVPRLL